MPLLLATLAAIITLGFGRTFAALTFSTTSATLRTMTIAPAVAVAVAIPAWPPRTRAVAMAFFTFFPAAGSGGGCRGSYCRSRRNGFQRLVAKPAKNLADDRRLS